MLFSRLILIIVAASIGCATYASEPANTPVPIRTSHDILRVLADVDAERMPAALVMAPRFYWGYVFSELIIIGWPHDEVSDTEGWTFDYFECLESENPHAAIYGMLCLYDLYWEDSMQLDPHSDFSVPKQIIRLRRLATQGEEPARSRALALLIAVRDARSTEAVAATIAAARACDTEPLASALRDELSDDQLMRYVKEHAEDEDGSRDGRWALQVIAVERRYLLVPRLLKLSETAKNSEYEASLEDCFWHMGGTGGVSGLRYLIQNTKDSIVRFDAEQSLDALLNPSAED
ncbi:MAG: hypothetical protein ABFS86_04435 [Planctomycetota bacterium]